MLRDKIKSRLDEYMEFESSDLFSVGDPIIFGGAIRDIIADMTIQDIDILCGSESFKILDRLLRSKGYIYMDSLSPKDIFDMYSHIPVISEPKTYIKGSKIIQI